MDFTIFVFGSNLQGIHGAGAALEAKVLYGAEQGIGMGRTGNAYALPTKYSPWEPLPLSSIEQHVHEFIIYALNHPEESFFVTAVGCGLAGYTPEDIGPMFQGAPSNCSLPHSFQRYQ